MDLAKTLKTALGFERKVERMYALAAKKAADPRARRFLATMAREERMHVAYLEARTVELTHEGRVTVPELKTAVPDPGRLAKGAAALKRTMRARRSASGREEVELLERVVRSEESSTAFYREAVAAAGGDARALFRRFLEIEEGHTALAQAELDSVTGLGFWFDVREFDLEAA